MQIAKIENNAVTQLADHREVFPNTSFPSTGPSTEFLIENSCLLVTVFLPYDSQTQKLEAVAPYILDDQVYTVQVVPLSQQDLDQRSEAQANQVRAERTRLLQESDWTQVADAPVDKAAWATYRQALRDVTAQPAFPTAVNWPAKPE